MAFCGCHRNMHAVTGVTKGFRLVFLVWTRPHHVRATSRKGLEFKELRCRRASRTSAPRLSTSNSSDFFILDVFGLTQSSGEIATQHLKLDGPVEDVAGYFRPGTGSGIWLTTADIQKHLAKRAGRDRCATESDDGHVLYVL